MLRENLHKKFVDTKSYRNINNIAPGPSNLVKNNTNKIIYYVDNKIETLIEVKITYGLQIPFEFKK